MAALERRVVELEKKMCRIPERSGRTASERLTADRCAKLLVRGKTVPKTLRRQVDRLPLEEISPAIQAMIDATMGNGGNGEE